MGAKKRPFYRIVVADSRSSRDGRFIEAIGHYDPTTEPPSLKLDKDRAQYWLSHGARPSDVARALLKIEGFMGGVTKKAEAEKPAPKKSKKAQKAEAEQAAKPAEEPKAAAEVAEAPAEAPDAEPVSEKPAAEAAAEPVAEAAVEEAPAESEQEKAE